MRVIRGSVWPGLVTAAVPVGSRLMVSGCTMNSRVRVRVPSPVGLLARSHLSVFSVCVHAVRVPMTPASVSAEAGTTWRCAISVVMFPSTWSARVGVVGSAQVGELLSAEHEREAGGAAAAEQPDDAAGGDGGELVDEHQRRDRSGLQVGGDRQEVLDDGGGEHRRQQRPAVGVEAEQHDVAFLDGSEEVDLVARGLLAVEEPGDV